MRGRQTASAPGPLNRGTEVIGALTCLAVRRVGASAVVMSLVMALAGMLAGSAQAQEPTQPWDGQNPFNCELQNAGTNDVGPHPDVDPYCVEFDKTQQNITDSGIVDFMALEPSRVGAAGPKCFYFQADHWTGSVVQGQPPELWHWDGHYFFDKAQGIGGAFVENFRVGGQTQSPAPYAPPQYQPYFNEGGGGVMVNHYTDPDPQCVAKVDTPAERRDVYGSRPRYPHCVPPGGEMHRRQVGRARLGMRRTELIARLGKPRRRKHHTDRWCLVGDAELHVAYRGKRRRADAIWTSSRGHRIHDVGPGARQAKAKRRLKLEPDFRIRHTKVLRAPDRRGTRLYAGIRHRHVRWLAITDDALLPGAHASNHALRRAN
jgi:hypothetical protein